MSAIDKLFDFEEEDETPAFSPPIVNIPLNIPGNSQCIRSDITVYEVSLGVLLLINNNYCGPSVELWTWLFNRILSPGYPVQHITYDELAACIPADIHIVICEPSISNRNAKHETCSARELFRGWMTWLANGRVSALLDIFGNAERPFSRPMFADRSRTPALPLQACLAEGNSNDREGQLSPTSPLGLFVRRLNLSFHQMPFEQVVRLASMISSFVVVPSGGGGSAATSRGGSRTPAKVFLNAEEDVQIRDTALLIEQSIGNKSLAALRAEIDLSTTSSRSIHTLKEQAHRRYVLYLSSLAERENQSRAERTREAEEHLHVYFDYAFALASSVVKSSSSSSSSSSSGGSHSTPFDSGEQLVPYAALNLAQLHLALGNFNEGLVAVHEAIRISQERQDRYCTAHALYCLSKLIQEAGNSPECQLQRHALSEFLASCPREPHFAELAALNTLAVAPTGPPPAAHSDSGDEAVPALQWWQSLLKVDRIAATTRYRQPFNDALASQSKKARAAMWDSLGQAELAHTHTLLRHRLFNARASVAEASDTVASLAWQHLEAGRVDAALALLAEGERRFSGSGVLAACRQRVDFELAYAQGDLQRVEEALSRLEATGVGDQQELAVRRVRLLVAGKQLSEAVARCHGLLDAGELSVVSRIQALLLLGEIYIETGSPAQALPYVLEAVGTADHLHNQVAQSRALSLLANVLVGLQQYARALSLLRQVPPTSRQSPFLCVQLALLSALAHVGLQGVDAAVACLTQILPVAQQCRIGFGATTPKQLLLQVYHLLAIIFDRKACPEQRDAYSTLCLSLIASPADHL